MVFAPVSPCVVLDSIEIVNTLCDREESAFIFVRPTRRFAAPLKNVSYVCSAPYTRSS